jgi:predicted AlkP superfamily phosphohydrolase/phosphomutase
MVAGSSVKEKLEYTYPKELKEKVAGFHEFDHRVIKKYLKKSWKYRHEPYHAILKHMCVQFDKFMQLCKNDDFNFLFYWLGATDGIQHMYWDRKDIILKFYQEVEGILRQIIDTWPSAIIFIISDHGTEASPKYNFHINSWLENKGYINLKGGNIKRWLTLTIHALSSSYMLPKLGMSRLKKLWRFFTRGTISEDKQEEGITLSRIGATLPGIDWSHTKAYLGTFWGIYIKKDVVGDEYYDTFRTILIREMSTIKDANGNFIFKNVWRKEEIFKGKYLHQIPDIVFLTAEDYQCSPFITSSYISRVKRRLPPGGHMNARDGIIFVVGQDIKHNFKLHTALLEDITPTILHIFKIPIAPDIDGRVLYEIFKEGSELGSEAITVDKTISERFKLTKIIRSLKSEGRI